MFCFERSKFNKVLTAFNSAIPRVYYKVQFKSKVHPYGICLREILFYYQKLTPNGVNPVRDGLLVIKCNTTDFLIP